MTTSVYIAKSVYGGDGLGRLSDGRVVFVPGAFAGEHVKAEIVEERRRFVRARLTGVEDPSPERTGEGPAPAPGMAYANLSAKGECAAKAAQLAEFFERARIPLPPPGVPQTPSAGGREEDMTAYRNKAVYRFAKQDGTWRLGYVDTEKNAIADMPHDPLVRPEIAARLPEIRRDVFALLTQGAESVRRSVAAKETVTVRWTRRSGVRWWIGPASKGQMLEEEACGRSFAVPAGGFWQVNPPVGEALAKAVATAFAAEPSERLIDLYCGAGVLGILAALAAPGGTRPALCGVESGIEAAEAARRNAALHGVKAEFSAGETARCLQRLGNVEDAAIIVDPPRGGIDPKTAKWLAASRASKIICASCDPATMMRDLKTLSAAYSVESVEWFNMFPRTARFETLCVLRRRS